MPFNFELILTLATLIAGLIYLLDAVVLAKARPTDAKLPLLIEYSRSFFPVLLTVLILRSFLAEPFRIPSGSDKPTLLVGDFILVNKFDYGVRLPVLHTKIIKMAEPQRGDVMVFRLPVDPSIDYIKRVIGLPGDQISYLAKVLYINGKKAPQTLVGETTDNNDDGPSWPVQIKEENLLGVQHKIYLRPDVPVQDFSTTVPPGHYFVMGDNRDNSKDSRFWCNGFNSGSAGCYSNGDDNYYWGFVPEQSIVGKAVGVWFSWDSTNTQIRWSHMASKIH